MSTSGHEEESSSSSLSRRPAIVRLRRQARRSLRSALQSLQRSLRFPYVTLSLLKAFSSFRGKTLQRKKKRHRGYIIHSIHSSRAEQVIVFLPLSFPRAGHLLLGLYSLAFLRFLHQTLEPSSRIREPRVSLLLCQTRPAEEKRRAKGTRTFEEGRTSSEFFLENETRRRVTLSNGVACKWLDWAGWAACHSLARTLNRGRGLFSAPCCS